MANNRFNMQVTPKGYKAGGKVLPTKKAGPKAARSPSKQQRKMGAGAMAKKKNKDLTSNITGKKLTNKTAIDKINKTKAKYSALKESANSNNPMRTDRVFRTGSVNYRNPESAIEFYGDKGSKKGLAEKAMNKRIEFLKNNMATGGRIKKMGGGMMQRPMYKKGSEVKGKDFMSSSMKDARSVAGKSGGADSGKTGEARSKAGVQEVRIKKGIKKFGKKVKDIASLKKFHDFAEKQYIKSLKEGKTNRGTDEPRKFKAMGGSLKPVDPKTQKGLSKLPTEVRNKMGFMKKGGKVK